MTGAYDNSMARDLNRIADSLHNIDKMLGDLVETLEAIANALLPMEEVPGVDGI